MNADQITTIILSVISSGIIIKLFDFIVSRRKQKLEVTTQVQDVYEQFIIDTKKRLDEQEKRIAAQEKVIATQEKRIAAQDKQIAVLSGRVKTLEDENARLLAENARLKRKTTINK